MEIERKFLLAAPPFSLASFQTHEIRQGYISISPVIRLRQQDEQFILAVKGAGQLAREEFELPLTAVQFDALWGKTEGITIIKTRVIIPLDDDLHAELDVYHGALEGFLTVEVEFPNLAAANQFVPPAWFGKDVTNDSRYSNASLSQDGYPDVTTL